MDEIWRTTWGERTSPALLRLDGHERVALAQERDPRSQWPPYALFGLAPTEVDRGVVTGAMPVTGWLRDSRGELGFPLLAFVADAPLSLCVTTGLPPGSYVVPQGLRIEMMHRPSAAEPVLACEARQETTDGRYALSSGRLHGSDGTVQAVTIGRQLIRSVEIERLRPLPSSPPPRDETDLPFSQPPAGEPVEAEVWARRRPLDVVRHQIEGRLPLPPLYHLTGMRPVHAEEGKVRLELPAVHWLDTPVFGGALTMLAATAIELAADTGMGVGRRASLLDLSCDFLRPGTEAGPDIEARAHTIHVGQQTQVVDGEVVQGRRTLVTARATLRSVPA